MRMTQERKNEVYDKMLAWVFEHVKNDKELFRILHEEFGMTKEEFHDNGIDSLDYLFDTQRIKFPPCDMQRKVDYYAGRKEVIIWQNEIVCSLLQKMVKRDFVKQNSMVV